MQRIKALIISLFFILNAAILVNEELQTVKGRDYPTRGDFYEMDMNISTATEASFIGEDGGDWSGCSVSGAGDVNGDGYDDILIGAHGDDDGGSDAGQTYLILGKASGLTMDIDLSNADASFIGEDAGDHSGNSVSGAGDVNGDGYDDILIGASGDDDGGSGAGQTYLILGKASGWAMDIDLSNADASFIGENAGDSSGSSVSGAGDVNGDGYDDILIGASSNDNGGYRAGQTYLILGKTSGWSMDINLSTTDASFIGEDSEDRSGRSVSGAGDVNGDGYDDILIGANRDDDGGSDAGQTYLILGKPTGWGMDTNLSNADASFIGESTNDKSGNSVSGTGDVNGDGYDDILIGACGFRGSKGQTYLIFGKESGWSNDTDLSNADASFIGEDFYDLSGWSVSGAGDVNGDGYDDLLIGAYYNGEGGDNAGQTYLILGKASGWAMDTDLSNADASFIGEHSGDKCGWVVSGAGDVNGDGGDDILIGAQHNNDGGSWAGQTYLITGVGNTEPTEVYSVDAYSEPDFSGHITMVDKGMNIYVELRGLDGNASQKDNALVEVSFIWTLLNGFNLPLRETGNNTGIYRGSFRIPFDIDYFEEITITSKKDPTKFDKLFVDSPFRPVSVSSLDIYADPGFSIKTDKFDLGQMIYAKVIGEDASPSTTDFAFVNITKNENETYLLMERLEETGDNTGIYIGSFPAPPTFVYFDNITIYSVRNHDVKDSFMVHTPLQIRPFYDNLTATEDEKYSFSYWNFGYETGIWTMVTLANWLKWDEEKLELYGTPDNGDVGPWDVWITLEDGKGHSDERKFQIIVENTDPEILTESVLEANEVDLYFVDYNSTDDGQGVVTWSIITYGSWLTIDEGTGILSGIPFHTDIGRHAISVYVDDGNGGTDFRSFDIDVIGFNRPPEIILVDITTGTQGELYYRDYEAHDPNENDVLEWFLDTNASFLSIENDTGKLTGTPGAADVGVFYVNVTVMDQDGLFDSQVFDLTIANVNDMPSWTNLPEDTTIFHGTYYTFDVNATDPDPDDFIQFSIRSKPESDIDIDPDTGLIEWTASMKWFEDDDYELDVTIKVSDGELFRIYRFTIAVLPTEPPTAKVIGPTDGERTSSQNTMLKWEGNDPENEPITYDIYLHQTEAFIIGLREEALYLEKYPATSLNVSNLEQGQTYYWLVIPHDGYSFGTCTSGAGSFRVNYKPTFREISQKRAETGVQFKLKVSCSDKDPEDQLDLKFSLINAPEGMTIHENTGMISWKPKSDQVDIHEVNVGVNDGIETATYMFQIDVIEGEAESSTLLISIIIGVAVGILILIGVFFVFKKKKEMDEKARIEGEHERDEYLHEKEEHQLDYEELYGAPASKKDEEGMTPRELKDYIHDRIDEIEGEE